MLSKTGQEISGCCIQAATRDFARFGQFILNGARGRRPEHRARRLAGAGHDQAKDIGEPGRGYGYQWWTYDDGSFAARGIFGQGIFIDPKRKLVIASNANWGGGATDPVASQRAMRSTRRCRRPSTTRQPPCLSPSRRSERRDGAAPMPWATRGARRMASHTLRCRRPRTATV